MALPFVFPSTSGPGRFTEVASFKKSSKNSTVLQESVDSAMHATSSFPPFRHCRLGDSASLNGDQNTLLIFDWTSPDEKKSFEGQSGNTALETAKASWGEVVDDQSPLAVAVSIEDPGTLVLIMGYPDKETAEYADKSEQHIEAKKVNDPLVRGWWKSGSVLGQVVISK